MPRKWPVTFGKRPLEKGRAYDTVWMVQVGLSIYRYLAGGLLHPKCLG